MSIKTIFIVVISVIVTIILMNNTDEIDFWLFGNARVSKLTILGAMFCLGAVAGFLLGRPRKKVLIPYDNGNTRSDNQAVVAEDDTLSEEDREYIR